MTTLNETEVRSIVEMRTFEQAASSGSEPTEPDHISVEKYTYPIIFSIGTICNILTFIVMRRKRMRHQSTYFYMAVLALTDEIVLMLGCLNYWIYLKTGINLALLSSFSCKLTCMLFYATLHFSVWMVVIMTIERFIAVALPLQALHLCTVKRAKLAVSMLSIIILAINFHFMFTHSLNEDTNCTTLNTDYENFMNKIWTWIDASIYSFVPLGLLILFNILIVNNLLKASKDREKMNSTTQVRQNNNRTMAGRPDSACCCYCLRSRGNYSYGDSEHSSQSISNKFKQLREMSTTMSPNTIASGGAQVPHVSSASRRLTIMLLVVSTTFLITSTPIVTLQTIELAGQLAPSQTLTILKGVFLSLQYLNHSVNFFLYAVTGKTFRKEFFNLFKPIKKNLFFKSNHSSAAGIAAAGCSSSTRSSSTRTNVVNSLSRQNVNTKLLVCHGPNSNKNNKLNIYAAEMPKSMFNKYKMVIDTDDRFKRTNDRQSVPLMYDEQAKNGTIMAGSGAYVNNNLSANSLTAITATPRPVRPESESNF